MKSLRKLNYKQRQQYLKKYCDDDFADIFDTFTDNQGIEGFNIENMIGGIKVPLGIAGPVKFKYRNWQQKLYKNVEVLIPLATTEGALVASVNRGLKLLSTCKTKAISKYMGASRGPFIKVKNIDQVQQIVEFIEQNPQKLQLWTTKASKHSQYLGFIWQAIGKKLYVRFNFATEAAMGMNMVTMATEEILKNLSKLFNIEKYLVSGNFCVDKKPSALNTILGRGYRVWVETNISENILEKQLNINSDQLISAIQDKQIYPALLAGTLGANAQAANVVAAYFLATGQDLAHVVEASSSYLQVEKSSDGVFLSLYMPAVMLGSLGGGTRLPSQKQALALMGVKNPSFETNIFLATSLAVAVLAGEISLTAALINQTLGKSHQKLARSGQI